MKQTQNYHLSQWEKTDRIKMEDFNSDNQKIDSQLHAAMQQLAQAASQEGLAAEQAAREAGDAAEAAARESADAQLRRENLWVELGETTLSSSSATASVTAVNAELYSQFLLLFNTSNVAEVHLTVGNASPMTAFKFPAVAAPIIGQITLIPSYEGGYMASCQCCGYYSSNAYSGGNSTIVRNKVFSGSISIGLEAANLELASDTHLKLYGMKK